jgi:E3 ubiquitin-protein ligase HUWE1
VGWFWRALESFDQQDRARFLMFVTGTSKVPLGGFKALRGQRGPQRFSLERGFGSAEALPQSHTCFNSLVLTPAVSFEALRDKLLLAIREGSEGFGMI